MADVTAIREAAQGIEWRILVMAPEQGTLLECHNGYGMYLFCHILQGTLESRLHEGLRRILKEANKSEPAAGGQRSSTPPSVLGQ